MFESYPDIMTTDQFCEALQIGKNTAYALLNEGVVKGIRIGGIWKVSKQALINYVFGETESVESKPLTVKEHNGKIGRPKKVSNDNNTSNAPLELMRAMALDNMPSNMFSVPVISLDDINRIMCNKYVNEIILENCIPTLYRQVNCTVICVMCIDGVNLSSIQYNLVCNRVEDLLTLVGYNKVTMSTHVRYYLDNIKKITPISYCV